MIRLNVQNVLNFAIGIISQRRLDPGKETLEGFFQVGNQKEYQNVVIISSVHLEKINIFCFMHKSVAQKSSLPCPLENCIHFQILGGIAQKLSPSCPFWYLQIPCIVKT